MNLEEHPHRRYNPLTGEWVLVSPHRARRPWQGQSEAPSREQKPAHDQNCYLCAGNERVNGQVNPVYEGPFVFKNDFPALLQDTPEFEVSRSHLFKACSVRGTSRVICFSERHDLTLPELPVEAIRKVVDVWINQWEELSQSYSWVAIFENKGAMMGCSNPHPHAQVWASDFLPTEIEREEKAQQAFRDEAGVNLLVSYAEEEEKHESRIVISNDHWIVVVPFWAVWPFETLLLPKRHCPRLNDLQPEERDALADILKKTCKGFDALFQTEFPYSMGWHGAPPMAKETRHWQLHAHFYPPLLRSAAIRKFLVGYEMLAEAQRDLTPEKAAMLLRASIG